MEFNEIKPVADFNFPVDNLSFEQKALYQYWLKIKGDRLMPKKADFNPVDLPKVLPHISMEDVHYDPIRFQVRLAGTKTSSLQNAKGRYLDEIDGTEEIVAMLVEMTKRKTPYVYTSNIKWDDRRYKTYSSLVVPFSDDGEHVTLAMACHHMISTGRLD